MIEREILKDIDTYEATFIGAFSVRNIVGFIGAGITGAAVYLPLKAIFIPSFSLFAAITCAIPFFLCGFWHPYGMPFEKFAIQFIRLYILSPRNRINYEKNIYSSLLDDDLEQITKAQAKAEEKKRRKNIKKIAIEDRPIPGGTKY